jgi:hypothetical protein
LELTAEGNSRVPEVAEVLFKYLDLLAAPGGINKEVRVWVWGVGIPGFVVWAEGG